MNAGKQHPGGDGCSMNKTGARGADVESGCPTSLQGVLHQHRGRGERVVAGGGGADDQVNLFRTDSCVCKGGQYEIVKGLACDDFSAERMAKTDAELREERAAVEELLG